MREILFRGKRIDNGEWVEGYLAGNGLICCGEPEDTYNATGYYHGETPYVGFVDVDPSTVGQFTALHDKNGKKIFEGDIVKHEDSKHAYQIIWNDTFSGYCYYRCSTFYDFTYDDLPEDYEVIGNIHDNKELLEG